MPDFVAPQLCTLVERPPAGEGWCHEIKFDGYRVQLRVESGEATLKTRKGLDWTDKFSALAKEAAALPDFWLWPIRSKPTQPMRCGNCANEAYGSLC